MAIIRLERQYWNGNETVYDGIVEEADDLASISAGTAGYHGRKIDDAGEGSAMYCLETDAVHIMKIDGTWKQSGEDDSEEDET